jgi:2-dehydro-3-deoxyglucarate aldolase/4-hydroxy-2-oxoheptanedioate aldolase
MIMEFATRGACKILDAAGVDFAVFDMEHSGIDLERVCDLIAWSNACSFTPFVRVPQGLYHFLARVMDAGAMGVMVANVETAEEARAIVDAAKYAPLGKRGVGLGTAHTGYVMPDPEQYFRDSNRTTVVICQIESETGVRNADAIAAVDGVDVLWVGHFDLTQSMGIPAQFHHERFLSALESVAAAARKHGRALGIQPGSYEQACEWMALGFNVISWQNDIAIYREALQSGVQRIREYPARYAKGTCP